MGGPLNVGPAEHPALRLRLIFLDKYQIWLHTPGSTFSSNYTFPGPPDAVRPGVGSFILVTDHGFYAIALSALMFRALSAQRAVGAPSGRVAVRVTRRVSTCLAHTSPAR